MLSSPLFSVFTVSYTDVLAAYNGVRVVCLDKKVKKIFSIFVIVYDRTSVKDVFKIFYSLFLALNRLFSCSLLSNCRRIGPVRPSVMTLRVDQIKEKYLRKFDFPLSIFARCVRKVCDELTHSVGAWTSTLVIRVV